MTTQENRVELIRLAGLLSTRPISDESYKLDGLLTGLKVERKRLGQRKFLVLLLQKDYDIDGLTDWVYLYDSFDTQDEAIEYTDSTATELYERQTAAPGEYGKTWNLESQGEIPFMKAPVSSHWASNIRVLYDQTYKLRAGPYDSLYNCFRTIGPFSGDVISDELFSFVNQRSELWSYFVDVGEAIKNGTDRRNPR